MRLTSRPGPGAALLLALVVPCAAFGASEPGQPPVALEDGQPFFATHGGEHDRYHTLVTSALERSPLGLTLLYEVCNRATAGAVVFEWAGPNFQAGQRDALQHGFCAYYELPASKSKPATSQVTYPLIGNQSVETYLPVPVTWDEFKKLAKSTLSQPFTRKFDEPRSKSPAIPKMVELEVEDDNGQLVHRVQWYAHVGKLALKVTAHDDDARQALTKHLLANKMHEGLRVVSAQELLDKHLHPDDRASLHDSTRQGSFILIEASAQQLEHGKGFKSFALRRTSDRVVFEPALVFNKDERVSRTFRYATGQ